MKLLYRIYQLLFVLPLGLLATLITAVVTIAGCFLGNDRIWGYYPGKLWSWWIIRSSLLPVTVEGRENLKPNQSYVICPNHQGSFDIFLVYAYIGKNFKWVMKKSLRKIPFVGKACEAAGFVFVDTNGANGIRQSITEAEAILRKGTSIVIFPEGRRSWTGEMGQYKRGAFIMADELQLPVVPVTINGSFKVLSRDRGFNFVNHHRLTLTIHEPISPMGKGAENVQYLMETSHEKTLSSLKNQKHNILK